MVINFTTFVKNNYHTVESFKNMMIFSDNLTNNTFNIVTLNCAANIFFYQNGNFINCTRFILI